jgi:Icc protein
MKSSTKHTHAISRREFVGGAAALGLGAMMAPAARAAARPEGFRFVHMTDIHIQPELKADEGFRKALAAVHELKPRPDFILTGGDLVMDSMETPEPRSKMLFDLFAAVCKDSDIPFRHCVGNHDIFGWGPRNRQSPAHPLYGEKMVQERLGLDETTYTFEHKGWTFAIVNDVVPRGEPGGYVGLFTAKVRDRLDRAFTAAGDAPKIVCNHIPVMSVAVYRRLDVPIDEALCITVPLVCNNSKPILEVFRKHKVNLAIAGHTHENETIAYEHTTFITDGAVSGAWWRGPRFLSPEGFGVFDVRPDRTFDHHYHTYGWKAVEG